MSARICRTCRHWETQTGICDQWRAVTGYVPGLGERVALMPTRTTARDLPSVQVETPQTFGCPLHWERV